MPALAPVDSPVGSLVAVGVVVAAVVDVPVSVGATGLTGQLVMICAPAKYAADAAANVLVESLQQM